VSESHDRKFRDLFSLVIGILVGVVVGIFFLATQMADRGPSDRLLEEVEYQRLVAKRIAPLARVAVAGQDNRALAITPGASAARAGTAVTMPTSGDEVYQQVCVACHGQGIGGAPRDGDSVAWSSRIAKGQDTLYQHAIEGFQGEAGVMPPKGGRTDIPDELIRAAVDQMIEASHPEATRSSGPG
jgi:cytochrome c5